VSARIGRSEHRDEGFAVARPPPRQRSNLGAPGARSGVCRVRRRQDVAFVAVRGSRCAAPGWRGSVFAMTNRLPPWTSEGILPPFLGSPAAPSRSPYDVSLRELVERFGTTVCSTSITFPL
jgi:hypothetical protein